MSDAQPSAVQPPMGQSQPGRRGPVDPTPAAISAVRPLGLDDVRLDPGGLFGGWQARNAAATLPHCAEQLERCGTLDNMRRVTVASGGSAGGEEGEADFSGLWFADSDIYKTLEAVGWELARPSADPALAGFHQATSALVAEVQEPDGYLNSYFSGDRVQRRWQELDWSHEMYCAGHLIQAAVAAARVGVGEELVTVARRFADLLVDRFGPNGLDAVCGHPEVETALVELYRVTGHRPYLELAERFVSLRGKGLLGEGRFGRPYFQDHQPVRDADEVTGHVVRQLYLLAGVVDVAVETGDTALLKAADRLWVSAFGTKTYLTGGHGSRHRDESYGDAYELPPDRAYAETCAAVASFQWNWRMLLATGEARFADEMERTLYNAIAGSTAVDGRHFFYSNPLQLRTGHDGSNEDAPSRRLAWYTCPCCPPNLGRLMASLQAYVATADDTGLQIQLYAAGDIRATVRGAEVAVRVTTDYPWDGQVTLTVTGESAEPWTLALRVPEWCAGVDVEVDGAAEPATAVRGYLRLHRNWAAGTSVTVHFAMPPRLVGAHPHVDAVRGCVAIARGPLVYCLEQADLPAGAVLEDVRLDAATPPVAVHRADLPTGTVALAARGIAAPPASPRLYPNHPKQPPDRPADAAALELTAVPYFLWGNRAPGSMRVWLPVAPPEDS
jgi:uncharacterized protein